MRQAGGAFEQVEVASVDGFQVRLSQLQLQPLARGSRTALPDGSLPNGSLSNGYIQRLSFDGFL
jgi:hypothetical protein